MKGDEDGARAAFSAARTEQEKVVRTQSDDRTESGALCFLGLIDAALGRKQEALSEGRRAVELLPVTKNALDGAEILYFYAAICAQVGERDLAIEQLKHSPKSQKAPITVSSASILFGTRYAAIRALKKSLKKRSSQWR
jgi:tetratricopeptide (TPR) repeat protein